MIRTVGIISKPRPEEVAAVVPQLLEWLRTRKLEVLYDRETAACLSESPDGLAREELARRADLLIVLGGDGTLLATARSMGEHDAPILPVNLGGLGFLTSVTLEELYGILESTLADKHRISYRRLLQAEIVREGRVVAQHRALNDAVLNKTTLARMLEFDLHVDAIYVSTFRADGLILSTPTGSTAYSLSAGGPILYPVIDAFVITPICPHMLTFRPIVIPDTMKVEVDVRSGEESVYLTLDGQVGVELERGDRVVVSKSATRLRLVRPARKTYFEILRKQIEVVSEMKTMAVVLGIFVAGVLAADRQGGAARPPADLVILNGRVWTVDPARPRAEAVAVVGNRIAAVGSNNEMQSWMGAETRVLDAAGGSVLPGFIDSHVHFTTGGFELSRVQLRDATTPEEFARRIGEFARTLRRGEWILGGTWDHELWGGVPEPHREWIDPLTPEHPVFVRRYDGHMGLANSLALRLAGITRETPDPPGGAIVRDGSGEPTGLLRDGAMDLLSRSIPAASEAQRLRAAEAALAEARRLGVTSLHDISSPEDVRAYHALFRQGKLTARIYSLTPIEQWEAPAGAGIRAAFGNDCCAWAALKGFADGSLGSTTALFFEPYADAPETAGLPAPMMFPEGNMLRMALGADRAGLQLCIHAIGDRANREILEVFAEVARQNPDWNGAAGKSPGAARRWRIEHAQHIHPDDFRRFAELGVIASMQPYHAIDDGRWAEKRIGRERCRTTYAFRTFLNHGVRLAFGSDWTVAPLNPLTGIYAAVTRRTLDGLNPEGWFPEEKITLAEAIEAYTMGGAYAEFAEDQKGSLRPGKLADIVILDRDLFALPPERLAEARVRVTIVDGRVVHTADAP